MSPIAARLAEPDQVTDALTEALAARLSSLAQPFIAQAARPASETGPVQQAAPLQQVITRVIEVRRPAPRLALLRLELDPNTPYPFVAGQFCYVFATTGSGPERRPYSFASPPGDEHHIDLAVKDVNEVGESGWLYRRRVGDEVRIGGPLGVFRFHDVGRTSVFLATGTGVAPFRSMLLDQWAQGHEPDAWLFVGAPTAQALPYHEEFLQHQQEHPAFHYVPVVSRPLQGTWDGAVGHIQAPLRAAFGSRTDFEAYVCGVPDMVRDLVALLAEQGVPADQVHVERFV